MANESDLRQRWDDIFHSTPEFQNSLKKAAVARAAKDQQYEDAIQHALNSGDTRRAAALQLDRTQYHLRPDPTVAGLDSYQNDRVNTEIRNVRQQRLQQHQEDALKGPGGYQPSSYYNDPDFSQDNPMSSIPRTMQPMGGVSAGVARAKQAAEGAAQDQSRLDPTQVSPEQRAAMKPQQQFDTQSQPVRAAQAALQAEYGTRLELQARENALRADFGKTDADQKLYTQVWTALSPADKAYILKQPPERAAAMIRSHPVKMRPPSGMNVLQPFNSAMSATTDFIRDASSHLSHNPTVSPQGRPSAAMVSEPIPDDTNYMGDPVDDPLGGFDNPYGY